MVASPRNFPQTARGKLMRKTIGVCFLSAAALCVVVDALAANPNPAARATSACVANPTSTPPPGSHWFYRADRSSGRKCWFLASQDSFPRTVVAQKRAVSSAAIPLPMARPITTAEAETERTKISMGLATYGDQFVSPRLLPQDNPSGHHSGLHGRS